MLTHMNYFSVLVDETSDKGHVEQICISPFCQKQRD